MHLKIQRNVFRTLVKCVTLPMRRSTSILWDRYARTRHPPSPALFPTTPRPYRSSVALCRANLRQSLQTLQTEGLGLLLKSFAACAYKVICDCRSVASLLTPRCVTGMSLEKLSPTDTSTILSAYLSATQALSTIQGNFSLTFPPNSLHSPSSGTVHVINPSFMRYRELWRWVERLLRRAIFAASRMCSLNGEQESILWTLFSQYQTYNTYWPQTFRAKHRSTVAVLFIRALVLRARLTEHLPFILHAHFRSANSDVPVTPSTVARRAIQDYRDILNASTRFPKAGERNVQVEELTDLCVAVWEAGGSKSSDAAWVMDVSIPQKDEGC
jgi:hypothetical protein